MSGKIALAAGFADLSGADFASFLSEDSAAVSALFATTNIATARQIRAAQILFLYTHFAANGALEGTPAVGVRQIAQEVRSRTLVVASPVPGDTIENAMGFPGPKTANLVFTLDRKGPAFAGFFCALFERMRDGENLLEGWVELAPQGPTETVIRNLCCCPRVVRIAFAPRREQANYLPAFGGLSVAKFSKGIIAPARCVACRRIPQSARPRRSRPCP
jgi:hypothetical protein